MRTIVRPKVEKYIILLALLATPLRGVFLNIMFGDFRVSGVEPVKKSLDINCELRIANCALFNDFFRFFIEPIDLVIRHEKIPIYIFFGCVVRVDLQYGVYARYDDVNVGVVA